jgi:EAL domain-containing protein (putative c-di-GMP-specific phosphodiesterase class I)
MLDRDGRLMLPGAFLPAAERYGLIQRIDMWVIDTLFAALHEHRPAFSPASHPHVNVNLSGGSFSDTRVADHVHRRLQAFSVDPTRVAFEITETAAISNLATAKQFIQQIKSLGCRIALDDFGSGMSSLTYLKELDIDYVKIDGSFVHDIETNDLSQAIVRAIVDIARLLGIRTVAEFATTQSIVERLCELGICGVQGQAVGDPVPLEAFLAAAD